MFGSALYYPYIEVRDSNWLRSSVLFWDSIQTIVPTSISKPYHNADTLICQEEGYLQPLYCDLHQEVLRELGARVIALLERPNWSFSVGLRPSVQDPSVEAIRASDDLRNEVSRRFHYAGIYPEKLSPELRQHLVQVGLGQVPDKKISNELARYVGQGAILHDDKVSEELKSVFGYRDEYNGEFFIVNDRFAALYMAALAATLARATGLSPLTTKESYQGFNLKYLFDEVAGSLGHQDARGTLVTLVLQGLHVNPETPIQKLIDFRRKRATQLAELSAVFDELKLKIEKSEEGEIEEKAKRVVENQVRPGLEKLKRELASQTILSAWTGLYQAATLSAGGGGALLKFADAAPGIVLGTGAFLTATNVAVNAIAAYQKVRASSPYTYLLDVKRRFSLPVWLR